MMTAGTGCGHVPEWAKQDSSALRFKMQSLDGEEIDLARYKGRTPTKKEQKSIRADVAEQIETQLAELLFAREQHKGEDGVLRRLLTL